MDSNKNRFSEIAEQQNISFGKTNTMHTVSADAVVALDFFFYPQFYLSKKSGDYLLSSSHFGAKSFDNENDNDDTEKKNWRAATALIFVKIIIHDITIRKFN